MNKQNNIEIEIIAVNERGEGVGRIDGKVCFVDGAVVGDNLTIDIVQQKKAYSRGRIVTINKPSPFRIAPPCRFSARCGGCSVQHIDYYKQLDLKSTIVYDAMQRIAGQTAYRSEPIIGMKNPYRYRNKALLPAAMINGKFKLGLYQKGSHQLVAIDDCLIQTDICRSVISIVESWAEKYNITAYNEKTDTGQLRHMMIRSTNYGEHMIGIITRTPKISHVEVLIEQLVKQHQSIVSVMHNVNPRKGNRILGQQYKKLYGKATIIDKIGEVDYELSMASFFQVNPIQTVKLFNKAIALAGLTGDQIVWDIYCGAGSITLQIAKHAKWVYGNEIVPQAIVDAKANAARNQINNVTFIEGAAEAIVPTWLQKYPQPEIVFLDPPRKGADQKVLQAIVTIAPQKIVYISCKPSTLARDVKFLAESGYQLETVIPVDMFAHSMHVETIVLMSKKQDGEA